MARTSFNYCRSWEGKDKSELFCEYLFTAGKDGEIVTVKKLTQVRIESSTGR
jgi:hypothetical protein